MGRKKAPIRISEYMIPCSCDLKIAVVSDLHEADPRPVLDALRGTQPDVIAFCGDLFQIRDGNGDRIALPPKIKTAWLYYPIRVADRFFSLIRPETDRSSRKNAYDFLSEAGKIAPVLMVCGNHDACLSEEDLRAIRDSGTVLLDNSMIRFRKILFGGISGKNGVEKADGDFLRRFTSREGFRILLCHYPEYYDKLKGYKIDLILSGHAHGGQVRLFGRGLLAPGQGLFPRYYCGVYDRKLVVTAGCSNTAAIPRWGNPCEIVLVRLTAPTKP